MKSLIYFSIVLFSIVSISHQTKAQVNLKPAKDLVAEKDTGYLKSASLYSEYYKNKNFSDALIHWKLIFSKYPKSSKNVYIHGIKMYQDTIKKLKKIERKTKDATLKQNQRQILNTYVDTLITIYDQRIEYFKSEGYVLGLKAQDVILYSYRPDKFDEAYKYLTKSAELLKSKTDAGVLFMYMQTALALYKAQKLEKEDVVNIFITINGYLEERLKTETKEKKIKRIKKTITSVEKVFGNSNAADCETLIKVFTPKFESSPENLSLLKSITQLLDLKECRNTELFTKASEQLYKQEPSASAARMIAKLYLKKENYEQASTYYQEAIEIQDDSIKKAEYLMDLAIITQALNNYAKARSYAYEALKFKPNWGNPYIFIGDLYVSSRKSCGGNDFELDAIYLAAVDKYKKAKAIDKTIEAIANKKILTYSKHFPKKEGAFFYGYTDGKPYTVGCWIKETTIIRTTE